MARRRNPNAGRKKGVPNLKRENGTFVNQYGVPFSAEQKKALERAVNRTEYYRKKQIANLPEDKNQLRLMGKQSDFIVTRQSRSLQRFKSLEDYEKFMDKQARIQSGAYLEERTRLYKRNHMKAIENAFGDDAKDVVMKIRMMKPEKYREMIDNDEFLEINYIYDPGARSGRLNQLRASLGMKQKEDDFLDEDY